MFSAIDPVTVDLLLTVWACACLVGLWMAAAAVLPWTSEEFEELDASLAELRELTVAEPVPVRRRA